MSAAAFFEKLQNQVSSNVMSSLIDGVLGVEMELRDQVKSDIALVAQVSEHTLEAGGKRLRPALVLLSALTTKLPFERKRVSQVGACLEMIHMASLIHDDVLDEASMRRGRPTAASLYGDRAGILTGDVLLAKAMRILAIDGDLNLIRMVSESVIELAEGEVLELDYRGQLDLSMEEHLRVLRMKTAAFVEACCRSGAIIAGADEEMEDTLGAFGHHLGMAFQIKDDVLDYLGDTDKTGKPKATDFREGCLTLPLVHLMPRLDETQRAFVQAKFGTEVSDEDVLQVREWMVSTGAGAAAVDDARTESETAFARLRSLPDSEERNLLECITGFVTERDR